MVWSENLPNDVPKNYTVPEVASFTRWYLQDYPVYVWHHPNGLFVLGSPKGSVWKLGIEIPERIMEKAPAWLAGILLLNGIAAVLLALLFSYRLFCSLRPIGMGIEDMAKGQPVELAADGILGDLAAKLNQTSGQLQRQAAALQKRDNARTAWIAGVSHDIRTPLSMVMGYASQMEENSALPVEAHKQAGIIRRQSEKIKGLVSNLNLASKLEYDMQPLRLTTVYPAALVRNIVADFLNSGLDERFTINLKVEDDAQGIQLNADEELIRRAVSNLIGNSIRHNPQGCAILVVVEKKPAYCAITIADSGIGFPPKVLENIPRQSEVPELHAHGMGLVIVRQIIKAHGGTAEFENLSQCGCQVVLKLPTR
ncbi:MAG: HAMP domain-containing sensor histidine kinase [Syntrophomonadaceae bacterium]|nr:HAMP domain-containing sensor histidine kinase [Syntrophomonadaceae bacterium]